MTGRTNQRDGEGWAAQRPRTAAGAAATAAILALVLAAALGGAAGGVAAQNTSNNSTVEEVAPYYANGSADIDNESWMSGNTDGNDPGAIITMLTRVGTFIIGGNGAGGGAFLTGMLVFGLLLGMTVDAPVGMVGGGVLAVISIFGVVAVGLAPAWLTPVAMFGVAILLSSSARRVLG